MRKTHSTGVSFNPDQIIPCASRGLPLVVDILPTVEKGTEQEKTVAKACRALPISERSFYRWRQK